MFLPQFWQLLSLNLLLIPKIMATSFAPSISVAPSNLKNLESNKIAIPIVIQAQADRETSKKRPAPPPRIPPNKVKPGGGLDFSREACSKNTESLTALVPVNNPVLTTQPYPSFLFYIPDTATSISHGEFSLLTANEKKRIYATTVTFEQTPGIIKIEIPPSTEYALEEEQYYHWYLRVYCHSSASEAFLDVDGWIHRVALTPTRKLQIEAASPDIWYDAIAQTADQLITSPQNLVTRDRWLKLLQHINLEHLADDSVVDIPQK